MAVSTHWNPAALLTESERTESTRPYALVILNQPISNVALFLALCSRAQMIVAVDGGANRLHDLRLDDARLAICMPHAIVGDLDSLRADVRAFFAARANMEIHEDHDTESTDFGKAMAYIEQQHQQHQQRTVSGIDVLAFGGLGGRADHAFGLINQLYVAARARAPGQGRLFLATAESLLFVLDQGYNVIHAPRGPDTFAENVGIVPIGVPASITIQGFQYDVENWDTRFGGRVSTSNQLRGDPVYVHCSEMVLFTMEFALKPVP